MRHEHIDAKARVWVVTLDADGRLEDRVDPELLARVAAAQSAKDVENVLTDEIARTRSW